MSKRIISIILAVVMAVGCFTMMVSAENKPETKVSFTANSNNTDILIGKVFSDYSAEVTVPKGSIIDASGVSGTLTMTDIASLGIEGTRTYSKSITTGVEKKVLLDNYLPYFTNATVSGAIDGNAYFYNIKATDTDESYTIEAVPSDVEETRVAFQALASHVKTSTKAEDDSYALIPGTAYLQIGTEKLSLENTEETFKLDNIVQGSGLKAEVRSAVKLEEVEELEDAQVEAFIPAGTVLAIGNSVVELKDDATIQMYGYEDSDDVNTILSKLRDCQTNEEIILTAVLFISDFANAIEGKDLVVNVDFAESTTTVSGTVETFMFEDATTLELINGEEVIDVISVDGMGVQSFTFENVKNGTYTIAVSKSNHVTREYEITVDGEAVAQEFKIHLKGDITGDGKINVQDYSKALRYVKKTIELESYEFDCADVSGDGNINIQDYSRLLRHVKKTETLW